MVFERRECVLNECWEDGGRMVRQGRVVLGIRVSGWLFGGCVGTCDGWSGTRSG